MEDQILDLLYNIGLDSKFKRLVDAESDENQTEIQQAAHQQILAKRQTKTPFRKDQTVISMNDSTEHRKAIKERNEKVARDLL